MRAIRPFVMALAVLSVASMVLAQGVQTGSLRGLITDPDGGALPGVTITAASPAIMGGSLTAVSSSQGVYRFPSLPPGTYEIRMELTGFNTISIPEVRINVGLGLTIDLQMQLPAVEEQIVVRGETPIIDTKHTSSQVIWTAEDMLKVPSARDFWATAQQTPGFIMSKESVGGAEAGQSSDFQVSGSIGGSHQWNFNGIDMSLNLSRGRSIGAGYFNMDAFQEVQFTTSGMSAEYSRGGLIVNTVVKNGGNSLHGMLAGYYEGESFQGNNLSDDLIAAGVTTSGVPLDYLYDLSAQVGGPIWKDRIWFFEAFREFKLVPFVVNCVLPSGVECTDPVQLRNFTTKVTAQVNPSHRLMFQHEFGLKRKPHRNISQFTRPEASRIQDGRHFFWQGRWDWIINNAALFEVTIARGRPPFPLVLQPEAAGNTTGFDEVLGLLFDAGRPYFEEGRILTYGGKLSYFIDDLLGTPHDIRVGFEHRRSEFDVVLERNGDLERRFRAGVASRVFVYNTPVEAVTNSFGLIAYVQDDIRVGQRLTVNLGFRVEDWTGEVPEQSNEPGTFADIFGGGQTFPEQKGVMDWANFSPRLGVVFDISGNSTTVLKASYGRYYLQMHSRDIANFANRNGQATAIFDWTDSNGNGFPERDEFGTLRSLNLPRNRSVVSGLVSPHSDEFSMAVERAVPWSDNAVVSARYTYKKFNNNFAETDLALPDSAYSITSSAIDPLTGEVVEYFSLGPEFATVINERVLTQFEENFNRYHGVDLTFNRRFDGTWQLMAGLTISDNFGRVGGFLDRNDRQIFPLGAASLDAPYLWKVVGAYILPYNINFSGFFRHKSGMNAHGRNPMARLLQVTDETSNARYRIRVEENGSFRQQSTNILDMRVSKIFDFAGGYDLELSLDVFNLTNGDNILQTGVITGRDYLVPRRILPPRIFKLGAKFIF